MTENKNIKKAGGKDEDWAIFPFDEAEDDERWSRLSSEMEKLAKKVADTEAEFGEVLLMDETLSDIPTADNQEESEYPF